MNNKKGLVYEDQFDNNVINMLSDDNDVQSLKSENNDSIVAALNEIYGKDIISNVMGKPLTNVDSFAEMGDKINSLLSTFKTNMLDKGVVVNDDDKFKALIDKIPDLTNDNDAREVLYNMMIEDGYNEATF